MADAIYEMGEVVKDSAIEISLEHKNDEMIISFMDYYSRESNLYYDIKDFVNFHTAMKCSNLVILSGLSGTGKSQLVEIYAKALGIDNDDLENVEKFEEQITEFIEAAMRNHKMVDAPTVEQILAAEAESHHHHLR